MLTRLCVLIVASMTMAGCAWENRDAPEQAPVSVVNPKTQQSTLPSVGQTSTSGLILGEVMAVAYSGFRKGQHPDRGHGAINPSEEQILEDLELLIAHNFHLIRLYDSGENSAMVLKLIHDRKLPIKVLLGIWLDAEISNHERCSWLNEPIPQQTLAANTTKNVAEISNGITLANRHSDIVVAVNVGNEALVGWTDHLVSLERVISYVRRVKWGIDQPVTVADNYEWWIKHGATLAAEVDFIGVHSYPLWENKPIEQAIAYTVKNIEDVQGALPGHSVAILEAGWASVSEEFPEQANEAYQHRYFRELHQWAQAANTTVFFFEAFDEPWKGDPSRSRGIEKHWGLFNVDRTPKQVMTGS